MLRTISVVSLFLLINSTESVAKSSWQVFSSTASTTIEIAGPKQNVFAAFVVSFGMKNQCKNEIGLMLSTSLDPGSFVSRAVFSGGISVDIDGEKYSSKSVLTKYTNGYEITMYGNDNVVNKIKSSKTATITIAEGARSFQFPLEGGRQALNEAYANCYATR